MDKEIENIMNKIDEMMEEAYDLREYGAAEKLETLFNWMIINYGE